MTSSRPPRRAAASIGFTFTSVAVLALSLAAGGVPAAALPAPAAASARSAPAPAVDGPALVQARNDVDGADEAAKAITGVDPEADPAEDSAERPAALTAEEQSIDFQALGVTWDADPTQEITSVRVRLHEEQGWTSWHELGLVEEGVAPTAERTGTDPLLTNGADGYQVEVHTASGEAPAGLEVNVIDPGHGALDARLPALAAKASEAAATTTQDVAAPVQEGVQSSTATALQPAVVTRQAWGANPDAVSDSIPVNARVSAMYIHHTATSNDYTPAGAAAQLRAIEQYQAVTLGWEQMGYHFLVDKYGTVYEGIPGSMDGEPRGAHAYGFNTDTFAVSALGHYGNVAPSTALLDSITEVLAWKGAQHGLDVTGTVTLTSAGNSTYPAGTRVTGDVVKGHYATNATACPGQPMMSRCCPGSGRTPQP